MYQARNFLPYEIYKLFKTVVDFMKESMELRTGGVGANLPEDRPFGGVKHVAFCFDFKSPPIKSF